MKRVLQIGNGIAFVSTLIINYLSNTGVLNNTTVGSVSDNYSSLFTPAGYTFAIWGLIYLLLFGFIIYQGRSLFVKVKDDRFIFRTSWWFMLSCAFNSAWIFAWIYGYIGLSCVFIFLLLFSIFKIVFNNRMELDDEPISVIVFLWWPFVVYAGWVTVASIANVSTYLLKTGWSGFGLSDTVWTIVMIFIAVIINVLAIYKRNMREFALVGAWALIGIANANKLTNETIVTVCYIGATILLISGLTHAFINRKTNPLKKFKQYLNPTKEH